MDLNTRPTVLLFDVNETLLDVGAVKRQVGDLLQEPGAGTLWFTTMLHYSLVLTVSGQYAGFPEIGAAALRMLARNADLGLSQQDALAVMAGMRTAAAHPEVIPALERLQRAGFRMASLTNSTQAGAEAQLAHAGLDRFFERQLSVQGTGKFKPHRDVYLWAADEMGVQPSECMLVAAHGWDVAGAAWAGMRTAFVAREGQQKFPLAPEPALDVPDLAALATRLTATQAPSPQARPGTAP
ncbi:haloacid dehalogenase type II [Ramlibacter tataouinensis]|uniref:(S)-2-haloacid dehalogenase n=1 Tax=Ramlibacter tataouinensis (strain ATCC BAA-407 / DSM 14655 / LMG 21543 / TTB310) TaxID=365046 RepID=F5Y5W4_RAMTT|nr:haloacid dehalogenase type II [Ramlibacter tataouinensis]AEG91468.1 (S)-2-haloacid dehalogenase-like protein [Ramlibacter tataouinensis TTB310]